MTKFLLSVHVLAVIMAIGPVTVAASMFPAAARRARAEPGNDHHPAPHLPGIRRHRNRGPGVRFRDRELVVLPRQDAILATATETTPRMTTRLAMYTGTFNLLWVVVTVLMIVRPGSTTGA